MKYLKRLDGTVFGKNNPSKEQIKSYKKDGCKECDADGKPLKTVKKAKKDA
tara:strand:+ start:74 stop:226 length:153 start_codon:yes stop_codon:yes gene_type:complete